MGGPRSVASAGIHLTGPASRCLASCTCVSRLTTTSRRRLPCTADGGLRGVECLMRYLQHASTRLSLCDNPQQLASRPNAPDPDLSPGRGRFVVAATAWSSSCASRAGRSPGTSTSRSGRGPVRGPPRGSIPASSPPSSTGRRRRSRRRNPGALPFQGPYATPGVGPHRETLPVGPRRSNRFAPPVTAPFSLPEEARGGPETGAGLLPVRAYVQTPEALVRVEGEAVSQTPDAVLVRFGQGDGYPLQAWIWRSAVRHRSSSGA